MNFSWKSFGGIRKSRTFASAFEKQRNLKQNEIEKWLRWKQQKKELFNDSSIKKEFFERFKITEE